MFQLTSCSQYALTSLPLWLCHTKSVFRIVYYLFYSITYVEVEVLLHFTVYLCRKQRLLKRSLFYLLWIGWRKSNVIQHALIFQINNKKPWSVNWFLTKREKEKNWTKYQVDLFSSTFRNPSSKLGIFI